MSSFKRARRGALAMVLALASGCRCESDRGGSGADSDPQQATSPPDVGAPRQSYLPDGSSHPPPSGELATRRCPSDMVDVAGEFCIDRHEANFVDHDEERPLSPFYHPTRAQTSSSYAYWTSPRATPSPFLAMPASSPEVPVPPDWQLRGTFRPRARNQAGLHPQGYLSGVLARAACENAGKRLCREAEWVRACRGELGRAYPYGDVYEPRVCNVARESHPAAILHGNASTGHRDPRLNLVKDQAGPLLRLTGSLHGCASRWGDDAIYDMVGNLDEWIDDDTGVFLGGFYARQTEAGCAARIGAHAFEYFDYSLGVRCCS